METIAKIAASVASQARPEKQEPQVKMEAADQRSWGLDLRWEETGDCSLLYESKGLPSHTPLSLYWLHSHASPSYIAIVTFYFDTR